jgi:hypothetical protein
MEMSKYIFRNSNSNNFSSLIKMTEKASKNFFVEYYTRNKVEYFKTSTAQRGSRLYDSSRRDGFSKSFSSLVKKSGQDINLPSSVTDRFILSEENKFLNKNKVFDARYKKNRQVLKTKYKKDYNVDGHFLRKKKLYHVALTFYTYEWVEDEEENSNNKEYDLFGNTKKRELGRSENEELHLGLTKDIDVLYNIQRGTCFYNGDEEVFDALREDYLNTILIPIEESNSEFIKKGLGEDNSKHKNV